MQLPTGHTIIEPKPSLVPLVSEDTFIKIATLLKNVSISGRWKAFIRRLWGNAFTHYGLSGP